MIEKDVPLADLSASLTHVLDQWRELDGEHLGCAWTGFHLEEMPPELLPTTLVVDVHDDMSRNTFRFWGTGMYHIHGGDMTGKTVGELMPPEFRDAVLRSHAKIVAEPRAYVSEYGFERHGGFDHLQTALRLPLSDDGQSVNHIIVVIEWTSTARHIKSRRHANSLF